MRRFTRIFGDTRLIVEDGPPVKGVIPKHGDTIYEEDASTVQVQHGREIKRLPPPRGMRLPPNWEFGGIDQDEFSTEL